MNDNDVVLQPPLTMREVAALARCHVDTVRRAIARGDLRAHQRQGGANSKLLIEVDDAMRWIKGEK